MKGRVVSLEQGNSDAGKLGVDQTLLGGATRVLAASHRLLALLVEEVSETDASNCPYL